MQPADGTAAACWRCPSLTEYFRDALQGALAHQHLAVEDQTEQYVVNMLTLFARAEHLYEGVPADRACPRWCNLFASAARGADAPPSASARCSASATSRCSSPASSRTVSRAAWSTSTITSPWADAPTARWPRRSRAGRAGCWRRCTRSWRRSSSRWSTRSARSATPRRTYTPGRRAAAVRDLAAHRQRARARPARRQLGVAATPVALHSH